MFNEALLADAKEAMLEGVYTTWDDYPTAPKIITPLIYERLEYLLRGADHYCTLIFVGFGEDEPLVLPEGLHCHQDVWIIESVYQGGRKCQIDGDLYFLHSKMDYPIDRLYRGGTGNIEQLEGIRILDYISWQNYRQWKSDVSHSFNPGFRVDDEQDEKKGWLYPKFRKVFQCVPKLDFLEIYGDMCKNKEGRYFVVNDCVLLGPYEYQLPDKITYGDLYLVDNVHQLFPKNGLIQGKLQVINYFYYADDDYQ